MSANPGRPTGSISVVALSFMVHEPSGIIPRSRAKSRSDNSPQVAQHRRLGVVLGEDRVSQDGAAPSATPREGSSLAALGPAPSTAAPNASSTAATWSAVVVSPHEMPTWSSSTRRSSTPPSRGRRHDVGRAAGCLHHDGVEVRVVHELRTQPAPSPAPIATARRCTRRAIARSPSGPWYTAYIPATTARSTWAVQMLEVAFSRRMCCSRVWSASR